LSCCDGGINAMVEGSKFKESHVLENTKLWNKVGRMPRPLVLFRPSNSGLASFCACFRYPVLGRSCPYASRHTCDGYSYYSWVYTLLYSNFLLHGNCVLVVTCRLTWPHSLYLSFGHPCHTSFSSNLSI
jgi:hypothetical protein